MAAQELTLHVESVDPERISASVCTTEGRCFAVETEANCSLDHWSTPWLPPTLAAAMKHRWDLTIDGTVDEVALARIDKVQRVISGWYPRRFHPVGVSAESVAVDSRRADGVGCFFSGGVDSFYSAITHADRISHLIFVHGFDIRPDDQDLAKRALGAARAAAADLGKPLIEIKTTIRSALGDPLRLPWGGLYHGPCLAHVGLALSTHLRTVIIPSSLCQPHLHPWGSHPDLDPWWSSGAVSFEHDEVNVDRLAKIRRIAESEAAMNHLRVCWLNKTGSLNCGRCAKCIRTKLGLMVAGVDSPMLPGAIDRKAVRHMVMTGHDRILLRDCVEAMRLADIQEPELDQALRVAIRRSYFWQFIFS